MVDAIKYGHAENSGNKEKKLRTIPKTKWARLIKKTTNDFFSLVFTKEFHKACSKAAVRTIK